MKLTLMQQALNLFGRSDGAIGFNTIAVKQKKPVRCFRSGYGNQISIPIADAEKRTSNAGSLLRTSSLWLQSVVCFCRMMSGGHARAKDVGGNMGGRQAR